MHGDIAEKIARESGRRLCEIIDFASNINPYPPRDIDLIISKALKKVFFYPESSYESLVEVISSSTGWSKKNIVFGNGSIELINAVFRIVEGDRVLIPYPTFTEYKRYAKIWNKKIVEIPFSFSDIVNALENLKVDVLILCNPNNPTGKYMKRINEINELCLEKDVKLIVDEVFINFVPYKEELENCFIIRSLTKIIGVPGIRFGYGYFPNEAAKKFHFFRDPWNVNVFAKEVAEKYLPILDEFSRSVRKKIRKERIYLIKKLKKLGFKVCGEANFLLVKGNYDSNFIYERLINKGIIIRRCNDFKGLSKRYFRISVRSRKENRRLLEELKILVEENS